MATESMEAKVFF